MSTWMRHRTCTIFSPDQSGYLIAGRSLSGLIPDFLFQSASTRLGSFERQPAALIGLISGCLFEQVAATTVKCKCASQVGKGR